jgi:hypothetical protein
MDCIKSSSGKRQRQLGCSGILAEMMEMDVNSQNMIGFIVLVFKSVCVEWWKKKLFSDQKRSFENLKTLISEKWSI